MIHGSRIADAPSRGKAVWSPWTHQGIENPLLLPNLTSSFNPTVLTLENQTTKPLEQKGPTVRHTDLPRISHRCFSQPKYLTKETCSNSSAFAHLCSVGVFFWEKTEFWGMMMMMTPKKCIHLKLHSLKLTAKAPETWWFGDWDDDPFLFGEGLFSG